MRTVAVVNPVSGRLSPEEKRDLLIREWGRDLRLTETSADDSVETWLPVVREERPDVVLVGGGDGTVRHVVAALRTAGERFPVAHLPFGTANLIARSLGFSGDAEEAAEEIRRGKTRSFDLGEVDDGSLFILAASLGMPAELLDGAERTSKDKLGFVAYLYGGIRSLERVARPGKVRVISGDEKLAELQTGALFVANLLRLEEFALDIGKSITPHDGRLTIAAITTENLLEFAWTAIEFISGREKQSERIWIRSFDEIEIVFGEPWRIQVDGEELGSRDRVEFRTLKDAFDFVVSESYEG
ncbi:MAG: hypothetical protein GF346_10360 [Candidatus Eisenbacteria bacterium]|nr:hypothetical protein [Candidatus Latescibacterota bacterium]MBD3302838.1 hypothetical protein [Candidatus Eisenbacteria bacterium]